MRRQGREARAQRSVLAALAAVPFACGCATTVLASPIPNPNVEMADVMADFESVKMLTALHLGSDRARPYLRDQRPSSLPPQSSPLGLLASTSVEEVTKMAAAADASPRSLKNVIRSLATRRRAARPPISRAMTFGSERTASSEDDYLDPIAFILESEAIGDTLRALVDIRTTDGDFTTFSVLGMGDFVFEVEGGARSAILYELSTGWSMALGPGDSVGTLAYPADPSRPGAYGSGAHETVSFVKLAWRWLVDAFTSPFGILGSAMVAIALFTWMAYRLLSLLQRRPAGSHYR